MRNHGELAEGWYIPSTSQRALEGYGGRVAEESPARQRQTEGMLPDDATSGLANGAHDGPDDGVDSGDNDDDDDEFGPAELPKRYGRSAGPTIPSFDDLQMRNGRSATPLTCYPSLASSAQ